MAACTNHPQVTERVTSCARCGLSFCPNCLVSLQGLPYCANCKVEHVRDVQSGVAAPGALELAGILHRFGAQVVDGLIIGIPLAVIVLIVMFTVLGLSFSDPESLQATMESPLLTMLQIVSGLVAGLIGMVYEALMLAARGQTLGKMALGIKVVTADGRPITSGQAWGRAAVRQGLGLLSCCGLLVDYLPAFFNDEKTTVHDMAAKTRVVFAR